MCVCVCVGLCFRDHMCDMCVCVCVCVCACVWRGLVLHVSIRDIEKARFVICYSLNKFQALHKK